MGGFCFKLPRAGYRRVSCVRPKLDLAGDVGIEPTITVLETVVIPLHQSPFFISRCLLKTLQLGVFKLLYPISRLLFSLFKNDVLAQLFAVLFELDFAGHELAVFARPIHLAGGRVL